MSCVGYRSRVVWRWGCGSVGLYAAGILYQKSIISETEGTTTITNVNINNVKKSAVIFLGTGSSVGTPHPYYMMNSNGVRNVSVKAAEGNPMENKNYRCNPSLLVEYNSSKNNGVKNIIIDVGKTFRESLIRWFPKYNISKIDSIVLTHGHADAIFGLDDVRGLQGSSKNKSNEAMNVYLSQECLDVVKRVFFYLFPKVKEPEEKIIRHVSDIAWNIIQPFKPFHACGLELTPLPVIHGEDLISLGFLFGADDTVCYISDISRMLPTTLSTIIESKKPISLLVLDALFIEYEHPTHYSIKQAVELIRIIKPKQALLVGMSGEIDHDEINDKLRTLLESEGLDVQLAYDGLRIELTL